MAEQLSLIVNAEPTKKFFVDILVRDIDLRPAVADLVDNSIDGARRIRPKGDFKGLTVRIAFDASRFVIEDNCGGIPLAVAQNYAFRFGRPDGMEQTKHSIGQFGVGMKRALFKIGSEFTVKSTTEEDSFTVPVNVTEWLKHEQWQFEFSEVREPDPNEAPGTHIEVSSLHEASQSEFETELFVSDLCADLQRQHQDSLSRGLIITVNGNPISAGSMELLQSEVLKPAKMTFKMYEDDDHPITVVLYSGLAKSSPKDAGWYIYCNGRLILGPDQTLTTGWGEDDEARIPKYHNQFAMFRGYAFFDSDDADRLPWTTTKTGVNQGSEVYKRARLEMIALMRPVIDFLNELDREKDSPPEDVEPLEQIVAKAKPTSVQEADTESTFKTPTRTPRKPRERQISIQYKKGADELEAAKRVLKVSSAAEVGNRTFDYFYERECED